MTWCQRGMAVSRSAENLLTGRALRWGAGSNFGGRRSILQQRQARFRNAEGVCLLFLFFCSKFAFLHVPPCVKQGGGLYHRRNWSLQISAGSAYLEAEGKGYEECRNV